jgi:dTDP-4-dehydrorhamnose reductase
MLGRELAGVFKNSGTAFCGTDREVDITNPGALGAFAEKLCAKTQVAWVVNCAAYTAVDKAEDDPETCRRLNVDGPGNIAALCAEVGAGFVHISTDYVFDGKGAIPYTEEDPPYPTGVYGITKRDGETAALHNNSRSYVIRSAWLYGQYGKNFVTTMLSLMNTRDSIKVVNDQQGSPTWARDLAGVIRAVTESREDTCPFGIYHYTDAGVITWYDFAREIYRQGRALGLVKKDCLVEPCTSAEYPSKAKRPAYSVLDKGKITKTLGITVPRWDESLREYLGTIAP